MKGAVPVDAQGKPVHPIRAEALKPALEKFKAEGKPFKMAMVFPVSTHNYELRYWLAAGGINPGFYSPSDVTGQIRGDVLISVTPPPQMPATLEAGTINGYSVGEPWNQQAIAKGVGVPVITDYEIWKNNPEKVFGVTKAWAAEEPEHAPRNSEGADSRGHVARREQWRESQGGGADPVPTGIRRRGLPRDRQQHDRHVRVQQRRQAAGAGLQRVLPLLRELPVLQRRHLVPHADASLGADS